MKTLIYLSLGLALGLQVGRTSTSQRPSISSSDSIDVGGMELRLGMSRADIVSKIAHNGYTTTGEGRSLNIVQKHGEAASLLGLLSFDDRNRLIFVNRVWTPDETDGPAIARGLLGAFSDAERQGRTVCNISTSFQQGQLADVKAVLFNCGQSRKVIEVLLTHYQSWDSAGVSEILQSN